MKEQKKNKKAKPFSKIFITIIASAIMLYTVAAFAMQYYTGMEISPTLTTVYFSFWGVELVNLAAIKVTKARGSQSQDCGNLPPDDTSAAG